MKIARIVTRLNLGGPARQVLASDPLLQKAGHQVRVFAGAPEAGEGSLAQELTESGVEVISVPGLQRGLHPWRDAQAQRFLRKALGAWRPDVVHTHMSKAGVLGRRAVMPFSVPTVHTFHGHVLMGHYGPLRTRLITSVERRLGSLTAKLLAVSETTKRELVERGIAPKERIQVVYGASSLERFERAEGGIRRELGLPERAFCIGVLGRLAPIKQPVLALRAFARALPGLGDAHLVFVGEGPQRIALEQELALVGQDCKGRVHMAGARVKMESVLPDFDCLLSASLHEGLPIAFVEAGAVGCPVVATPVGGCSEFVRHGETGWLGSNEEELAAGLVALAADPGLRRRMGEAAKCLAWERHSAEGLASRLQAIYSGLLTRLASTQTNRDLAEDPEGRA